MMFSLNSIVFPKVEIMSGGPVSALAELRNSLGQTQANIEASLPQGGISLPGGGPGASATGFKLPDVLAFFKGPGAQNAPTAKKTESPQVKTPKSTFNYR